LHSKKYSQNPFKFKGFRNSKRPATHAPLVISPQLQVDFSAAGDGTDHAAQPTSDPELSDVITPMQPEEETEEPQMSVPVSVGLLVIVTVVSLLAICPHYGRVHY
jgi:hypothetical protein